jgi:MFS family permease
VFAYIIYCVNLSAYFPLFGRLLSGVGEIGVTVVLGQIALQPERESRSGNFVLLDSAYCVGAAFGPGIGSFIAFRTDILGWEINEGNSPGIVLIIVWLLFLILAMLLPKDIWIATGARNTEHNSPLSEDEADRRLDECGRKEKLPDSNSKWKPNYALLDSRLFCLIFLAFSSEVFSSTSTFYVPVLALNQLKMEMIQR